MWADDSDGSGESIIGYVRICCRICSNLNTVDVALFPALEYADNTEPMLCPFGGGRLGATGVALESLCEQGWVGFNLHRDSQPMLVSFKCRLSLARELDRVKTSMNHVCNWSSSKRSWRNKLEAVCLMELWCMLVIPV